MTKLFQSAISNIRSLLKNPGVVGVVCAVLGTIVFLHPIIAKISTHLTSHDDGIFIAWTINWVGYALQAGQDIFNAPIFHPHHHTLTFSDPFLTSGLVNSVFSFFTENLVLQHNLHLVLGAVACFWGIFVLVHYQTKKMLAAYVAATFFSFSSLHLHYLVHLHTFLVAGLPLALYCFLRWRDGENIRWLLLSGAIFLAQALNSPMTAFFSIAVLIPFLFEKKSFELLVKNKLLILSIGVIAFCLLGIFYLPYLQTAMEFSYTRSIRDAAHFAHSLNRFFTAELLIIYLVLILNRKKLSLSAMMVATIGAILMLGPVIKINDQTLKIFGYPIPLPYAAFYYIVPGFKAFRASSRWITVFNFGLALLLGQAFSKLSPKNKWGVVGATTLTIFLWVTQVPQLQLYEVSTTTQTIYEAIHSQPQQTLAEFPVYVWSMHPYVSYENQRLIYQPVHQKQLYNGVSGFTPPDREKYWATISQQFPNNGVINHLKQNNIDLVLVHFDEYDELSVANYVVEKMRYPSSLELRNALSNQSTLRELSCDNTACLYTIE